MVRLPVRQATFCFCVVHAVAIGWTEHGMRGLDYWASDPAEMGERTPSIRRDHAGQGTGIASLTHVTDTYIHKVGYNEVVSTRAFLLKIKKQLKYIITLTLKKSIEKFNLNNLPPKKVMLLSKIAKTNTKYIFNFIRVQ